MSDEVSLLANKSPITETFSLGGKDISFTFYEPNMGHYEQALMSCVSTGQPTTLSNVIRKLMAICVRSVDGKDVSEAFWKDMSTKTFNAMSAVFRKYVYEQEEIAKNS